MSAPEEPLRVTMADIASAAGVSRATVSRALYGSGRIADGTRERIASLATELGYVPNVMARDLAAGSTRTVGLLLRDAANPAYGAMFTALQEAAYEHDVALVSMTITLDEAGQLQVSGLRHLLGLRVAGLVVATGGLSSDQLLPFASQVPIMRAGRPETTDEIHAVSYDEEGNARLVADHIAGLGHRRVAVQVTAATSSYPEYIRGSTVAARLREHGVEVTVIEVTMAGTGTQACIELVSRGEVSAVACPSDFRLLDLLRSARARGLAAPGDFSASGFDGLIPGSDLLGLTTVRLPVSELAHRVITNIVAIVDRPAGAGPAPLIHESLLGTLVPGTTVGPAAS